MSIQWKTKSSRKIFSYRYLLDHRKSSEPLDEFQYIKKNKIIFKNPKDGFYGFHIQLKDLKSKEKSPLYHIPIFWRYIPQEPEVELLNKQTKIHVNQGNLQFIIKNQAPMHYWAQVNDIPIYNPKKRINIKDGIVTIQNKLKPRRYFLHLKAQDQRSKQFSTILHKVFYVYPFDPSQKNLDTCSTKLLKKVKVVSKKMQKAFQDKNIKEAVFYSKELRKLRKQLTQCNRK